MGRQINFLCTRADFDGFWAWYDEHPDWRVLSPSSPVPAARAVEPADRDRLETHGLWYLTRADPSEVQTRVVRDPLQPYWVDAARSPVVELRVPQRQEWADRGRLYVVTGHYDAQGQWCAASPELLRWARQLFDWFKRRWPVDPTLVGRYHVGPDVAAQLRVGRELPRGVVF